MNYLKNERGSTLAITLMILVLFTVLGFGLFTINTSASKQFNNKEQQVQARHFAEMGLLHYKSEAEFIVNSHNKYIRLIKDDNSLEIDEKVALINNKNSNLCSELEAPSIISSINAEDPNYEISNINCNSSTDTLVDIFVESVGESSQGKVVRIGLDLSVTHPGPLKIEAGKNNSNETDNGGNSNPFPSIPTPPNEGINTDWPCKDKHCGTLTEEKYTDLSNVNNNEGKGKDNGTIFVQKGNLTFLDSLVMNNFEIGGGNGLSLTVEKDFYLKGSFKIQNHACVMVKGNFTSLNSISFGTKSYLYVYGDAYLNSSDLHKNSTIYVSGDVYVNGKKLDKNSYEAVPSSLACSLPAMPAPVTPPTNSPISGDLDAILITNEYRY